LKRRGGFGNTNRERPGGKGSAAADQELASEHFLPFAFGLSGFSHIAISSLLMNISIVGWIGQVEISCDSRGE